MHVAFLGLGIMGSRMAANVAAAGHELTVWTHTAGKAADWAQGHGARAADTPAQAAQEAELVVSMVVDGEQVLGLARELAAHDGAGRALLDMSTIGPAAAREAAQLLASAGWGFMDAPVTGSSPKAADGTLTIMAGGDADLFERARPLFDAMGQLVVHVGDVGQGQMVKVINNATAAVNTATVAQALLVGAATGLDLDALVQVMGAGSGASAMLALKAQPMRTHDYSTLFKLDHMLKDVRLCLDEARRAGVTFAGAQAADDALTRAQADGFGNDDFAAILETFERASGRRL